MFVVPLTVPQTSKLIAQYCAEVAIRTTTGKTSTHVVSEEGATSYTTGFVLNNKRYIAITPKMLPTPKTFICVVPQNEDEYGALNLVKPIISSLKLTTDAPAVAKVLTTIYTDSYEIMGIKTEDSDEKDKDTSKESGPTRASRHSTNEMVDTDGDGEPDEVVKKEPKNIRTTQYTMTSGTKYVYTGDPANFIIESDSGRGSISIKDNGSITQVPANTGTTLSISKGMEVYCQGDVTLFSDSNKFYFSVQ